MKNIKYFIIFILVISIILGPLLSKKALLLKNIRFYQMTEDTKTTIFRALFYFQNENVNISLNEIRDEFAYCDSLILLDKKTFDNRRELRIAGSSSPLFSVDLDQYLIYAIITNNTLAGTESLKSEAHYIWLPWGWYNIKNQILGGS